MSVLYKILISSKFKTIRLEKGLTREERNMHKEITEVSRYGVGFVSISAKLETVSERIR